MSLSNRGRWLFVAPLAGVERQGRGSLGSGSLAVGISDSLPSDSYFIQGTHPFSGLQSQFHAGQSLGGRGSVLAGQGGGRAGSPSLSRLLQPVIRGDESLRSVEAGHRPLTAESEGAEDILQDGDSPVSTSVGTSWRLDGVSRLEECVLAGSDASGISQVRIRSGGEGVPIQSSLLWSLHGSSGFHPGHGSCFSISSQDRHSVASLPRRLVDPGFLPGADSPCSGDSASALQVVRDSRQLGEVAADSNSALLDSISFRASPAVKRVEKLLSIGDVFLSSVKQPVSSWLELLGVLSSMIQLIPGGRLRMRSLPFTLQRSWDQIDQLKLVAWNPEIRSDLDWWLDRDRLVLGIALEQVSPQLDLWSDASDVGWGTHLGEEVVSGRSSP